MLKRNRIAVLLAAGVLWVGMALPALAHDPPVKHTSCQGFGQVFAAWAQGDAQDAGFKNGGQGIKSTAHDGLTIPDVIDAQPPGSVAEVVDWEHSLFCEGA